MNGELLENIWSYFSILFLAFTYFSVSLIKIQDMTFAFAGQQKNTRWGRCVLVKHRCCITGQSAQGKAMIVGFCALKMTRYKWDPCCVAIFFCQSSYFVPFKKSFDDFLSHTHIVAREQVPEKGSSRLRASVAKQTSTHQAAMAWWRCWMFRFQRSWLTWTCKIIQSSPLILIDVLYYLRYLYSFVFDISLDWERPWRPKFQLRSLRTSADSNNSYISAVSHRPKLGWGALHCP